MWGTAFEGGLYLPGKAPFSILYRGVTEATSHSAQESRGPPLPPLSVAHCFLSPFSYLPPSPSHTGWGKTSWPQKPSLAYALRCTFPSFRAVILMCVHCSFPWSPRRPHWTVSLWWLLSAEHRAKSRAQRVSVIDSTPQPRGPHKCLNPACHFFVVVS